MLQTPDAAPRRLASPQPRLGGGYLDDEAYEYATARRRPSQPGNLVLMPAEPNAGARPTSRRPAT